MTLLCCSLYKVIDVKRVSTDFRKEIRIMCMLVVYYETVNQRENVMFIRIFIVLS